MAVLFLGTVLPVGATSALPAPAPKASRSFKTDVQVNSVGMTFVQLPAGTFLMGTFRNETLAKCGVCEGKGRTIQGVCAPCQGRGLVVVDAGGGDRDETPHWVTFAKPFYMQATEVTQGQWKAVMGTQPWRGKSGVQEGDENPAVYVSWDDVQDFLRKLNAREGGAAYRLPTEAEWEYACRAGSGGKFCFGDDDALLGDYAWYEKNAKEMGALYGHRVATRKPNAWGLYDMHGNVSEWCQDWFGDYSSEPQADPKGPVNGAGRVDRGGGWELNAAQCRSAFRLLNEPEARTHFLGFRVLKSLP